MIEKNIEDLKVAFVGNLDWINLRDLLVAKFNECKTEEEFSFIIEGLIKEIFLWIKKISSIFMIECRILIQLKFLEVHLDRIF